MIYRILFTILILLESFSCLKAQNFNRPTPPQHPKYEFNKYGTNNNLSYLLVPITLGNGFINQPKNLTVLDPDGYISWYSNSTSLWYTLFQYHPEQKVFSYSQYGNTASIDKFIVLDSNFTKIDSIKPTNGSFTDIHDFLILANGNYVLTGYKDSLVDLSAFQFNGTQGLDTTDVKAAIIQEFDSNHNLIFEWNSLDYIHPTEFIDGYSYNVNSFDYVHINAVDEDTDGNFLVSMRHTDAIYKINKVTGNLMWVLGGKSNQFTFTNDNGFSGQHHIRRLPNGNISLFNNDNNGATPKISRGIEYFLDTTNMTCTRVWEYIYSPAFYAMAMGNCQTLPNNDRVIGYGLNYRPHPSFVHLDYSDNIITEVFLKDSVVSYRALGAEIPFNWNTPAISCSGSNGFATLTAPSGYNKYEWSTGETTSTIVVSDTGTYQVWVNYGIGMLGSQPFHINDIQNPCNPVSIKDVTKEKTEKIIFKVYDLLGREIKHPKVTQIYVVRYTDGSSQLIYWNNSYQLNE